MLKDEVGIKTNYMKGSKIKNYNSKNKDKNQNKK
jgi:hypothetical protein